jgi:glycosyltransferase involved in cell wall biosynthesis
MKVLVVSHLYPSPARASSLFVHDQVVALRELGVDVNVVSPTAFTPRILAVSDRLRARAARPATAVIDGVAVSYPRVVVPPRRILRHRQAELFYRGLRTLAPDLCDAGIDLIHAHQAFPDGAAARLLADDLGLPYVVTVHGADVNLNLVGDDRVRRRTLQALAGAAVVVTVSGALARRLGGVVPATRLHVVPNGVAVHEQVAPSALLPDRRVVLSVGNLYASKGHATVLAALACLGAEHDDVAWVVVGDGPERRRLEARASELGLAGRTTFLGWRPHDEVLSLMARADAFVLPSAPEGFGVVYAEAMAQGTPVVACLGEGPADFVVPDESGLLVAPGDVAAVAAAVARLLDDQAFATRLAEAGRRAIAGLTWQRNAVRQREIYDAVLAAPAQGDCRVDGAAAEAPARLAGDPGGSTDGVEVA